jgi:hypothetical protein
MTYEFDALSLKSQELTMSSKYAATFSGTGGKSQTVPNPAKPANSKLVHFVPQTKSELIILLEPFFPPLLSGVCKDS